MIGTYRFPYTDLENMRKTEGLAAMQWEYWVQKKWATGNNLLLTVLSLLLDKQHI